MAEYHVGCGAFGIYAGTVKKSGQEWREKSEVTEEALLAVATYIKQQNAVHNAKEDEFHGFNWKLKDGRRLYLCIKITDDEEYDDG